MMLTPTQYAAKSTSEHNQEPKFVATIKVSTQAYADIAAVLATMPALYDLDLAQGAQLDIVGLWVGVSRRIGVPLTGVYFAWDTPGLGWDQGVWKGPFDSSDGLAVLGDVNYRVLIRARIASNKWNGTLQDAQAILQTILTGNPGTLYIEDRQDMTMIIGLSGTLPDVVTQALLGPKYLHLVPAGVRAIYIKTSISGQPVFGFDVNNASIGGWDVGAWGV